MKTQRSEETRPQAVMHLFVRFSKVLSSIPLCLIIRRSSLSENTWSKLAQFAGRGMRSYSSAYTPAASRAPFLHGGHGKLSPERSSASGRAHLRAREKERLRGPASEADVFPRKGRPEPRGFFAASCDRIEATIC